MEAITAVIPITIIHTMAGLTMVMTGMITTASTSTTIEVTGTTSLRILLRLKL
jgi:hypothetical protein